MLCCSVPAASSNAPLRQSVRYPNIGLVVNKIYIRIFCDHINVLQVFDQTCIVVKSAWNSNAAPGSKGRPSLPSSALPCFFLPSFPPPSYLLRFLLPPMLRFYPSLPPVYPSPMSPLHPGGSGLVAKQEAGVRHFFLFKHEMPTPLVHGVS